MQAHPIGCVAGQRATFARRAGENLTIQQAVHLRRTEAVVGLDAVRADLQEDGGLLVHHANASGADFPAR